MVFITSTENLGNNRIIESFILPALTAQLSNQGQPLVFCNLCWPKIIAYLTLDPGTFGHGLATIINYFHTRVEFPGSN